MRGKTIPVLVLVAAVVAAVASVGWAFALDRGGGDGWTMHRYGTGMMGYASGAAGEPVESMDDARRQAQRFADRLDLEVGEVMRFSNHYYAELEEDGSPATEVLVAPETGSVFIEYGPAMMWNTRYGMMSDFRLRDGNGTMGGMGGGMMGGSGFADPTWTPAGEGDITAEEARSIAARWLSRYGEGLEPGEAEAFPGYYTLHVLRDGRTAGMMSVNASTGAPWYHWWHGRFLSTSE